MNTISDRLKDFLETKKISYYAFENSIGAGRGAISKSVKDNKSIGSSTIEKILEVYPDLNASWLLTGQGKMLLRENLEIGMMQNYSLQSDKNHEGQQIPLYDIEATAGLSPLFAAEVITKPIDYISIPRLPKCDGAVYVTGDSMYPLLKSGDIVLYKEIHDIKNEIFWGEMYLLSMDIAGEEFVTVKYIQKSDDDDCVKLVSQNKHHQDKDIPFDKIRALALVKASIRINSMN